jgi:hypothetical protein
MIVPVLLVVGAVLGLAGTFVPSVSLRGLAWGVDGIALVVATSILAVYVLRRGEEMAAAGFLVYVAGQTLVVSVSALPLEAGSLVFGAGAGLWAAGLALVSAQRLMPLVVRVLGGIAAALFAITALQILGGGGLHPLSQPLPFFAYPFLVFTLCGWAWWCVRHPSSTTG